MLKFLGFGQDATNVVATDQVIPLHWFEDGVMWKKVVVYTLFVFDQPLDPEILRVSLEKLVSRDGYRKLGARLRRNAQGWVEYNVPAEFGPDRPPVAYTCVRNDDVAAADHPVAALIPKPSEGVPAIVGDPEALSELMRGPEKRTLSLEDWLTSDRPVLGLHVVTFRDRTCVTISWPHLAFDALGKKAIIEGWTKVLQGREDEIPKPIGFETDPLAELGMYPTEEHLLADRRVGNFGMTGYAIRNLVGLAGAKEIRMVCIPAAFWQKMVADVRAELAQNHAAENTDGSEPPFVTEGDVLVAWWTRLCASHLGPDSTTTIAAQNPMSLRKVLEEDLLPPNRPFISMALGFATVVHPARDVLSKPLSWLALEFRRAIAQQGTRAQVEAYAALQREFSASLRMPLFFGDSGMYNLFYSNWQKAGLFDFDFAGAAVTSGTGKQASSGPVLASYIQCVQDPAFPEGWPISGKDSKGNYWISGFRAKGLWGKLEEELQRQVREGKV